VRQVGVRRGDPVQVEEAGAGYAAAAELLVRVLACPTMSAPEVCCQRPVASAPEVFRQRKEAKEERGS
jgi:hypothetical protein